MIRSSDKRQRLIEAAKRLMYQQGFYKTTLAHIAQAAEVPLGNVYYYFKTKEDIAAAVIAERYAEWSAVKEAWEQDPDPRQRLLAFVALLVEARQAIADHGCPVGSLCQELDKQRTWLADRVDAILKSQLHWVGEQFRQLGKSDAEELSLRLMVSLQGVSVLASALNDPDLVNRYSERLKAWVSRV